MNMNSRALFLVAAWGICVQASSAWARPFRADCRYHNAENLPEVGFCYASAIYDVDEGTKTISGIQLGVGCDYQTIFNDMARIQPQEAISDRFSPATASTPAVEVTPKYAFTTQGTYSSVLDVSHGRMAGTCYVQPLPAGRKHRLNLFDF